MPPSRLLPDGAGGLVWRILLIRFEATKSEYRRGERVEIVAKLKNASTQPIFYKPEIPSKERSSYMSITPVASRDASLQDVRDSHGTITVTLPIVEIKPGEVVTLRKEDLSLWYKIKKRDHYEFLGTYKVFLYEDQRAATSIWSELMADTFMVNYLD